MDQGPLSALSGRYAAERREGYRLMVESGLAEDDEELKEAMKRSSKAVGGWKFCRKVENEYRAAVRKKRVKTDAAMRRIEVGADPEELLGRVCAQFGVRLDSLRRRRNVGDARLVAARLLKEETSLSGREVGRRLGLADGSGLGNLLAVAERRLATNRKLRRVFERLSQHE